MADPILEAVKRVREISKKRNFVQTFDLIVNLQGIDLKKPENRMNELVELPYGVGKDLPIVLFADTIKDIEGVKIITSKEIVAMANNKRAIKKLARRTYAFLAEPKLMPIIGRYLGRFLAPRGKMPKVVTRDVKKVVESVKKSTRIKLKTSPVVQCMVGTEKMKNEEVAENIRRVLSFLEEKLPKGKANIKSVLLKLTMGPPVKIEV